MTTTVAEAFGIGPITRSADHRYTLDRITVPGVSGIIECIGASFDQAAGYGGKRASMAAIRLVDELPKMIETLGEVGAQRALNSPKNWGPDPSGAILGSEVHDLVSRYLMGQDMTTTIMTTPQRKRVEHFIEWWERSGWTLRLSEAIVLHPATDMGWDGWGGTLDILAFDADGKTVLCDLKTGGTIQKKAIIQVTGYGMCNLVQPFGSHRVWPMPIPDRYAILHLTEEGLREVPINVGQPERVAFTAALDIYHWNEMTKGLKL